MISILAKVLSVVAKILIARKISTIAMSVYSLTLPTLTLLLNVAQLGIPTTISKLIAKKRFSTFKIMQVSISILIILDVLIGVGYLFLVPKIANEFLKNSLTLPTLYGMVLLLPLVSLTSLLKGYFIGINKVEKTSSCQISEELTRLLFIVFFVGLIDKNNISLLAFFAMFSSIIGEMASLIHLVISLNIKEKNISKRISKNNNENSKIIKNIMKFSMLSTSTRLIGSIIYFFEPIIFTYLMIKSHISLEDLTLEYGIINSYVFPLILLPSFFSNCISMYMLPSLSYQIENKHYLKAKRNFINITLTCFLSGFICVFIIFLFPEFFLKIIYGKVIGVSYIKKYGLLISIIFIQTPMHMALVAFDKEKIMFFESIICNTIRILLFFLLIPKYLSDGMIIAIIISVYISLIIQIKFLFRSFKTLKNKSNFIINK